LVRKCINHQRIGVEANRNTYAADKGQVEPERKEYKELEYTRSIWRLRDSYTGSFRAPGMTTVYFKERPAWTMSYGGTGQREGKEPFAKPTFTFLKKALMQAPPDLPLRGSREFSEEDWKYLFRLLRGDITDFLAEEEITKNGESLFFQTIMGGIVIHKDEQKNPFYPWQF
jgi:hypothetical protein